MIDKKYWLLFALKIALPIIITFAILYLIYGIPYPATVQPEKIPKNETHYVEYPDCEVYPPQSSSNEKQVKQI